jgi:3-phosphoinositide dependent protein kinase-1
LKISNFLPQRDKHFVFEEPKSTSSTAGTAATSIQEWIDTLDRAKDWALSQQNSAYSGDEYRDLSSAFSSQTNTLDHSSEFQGEHASTPGRSTLQKSVAAADSESIKGKKRFSKRHSKNGLAAVF